jgi:hypothetical protein
MSQRRLPALHPLAVAFYPVIMLFAANVNLFPPKDMGRPLAYIIAAIASLWVVSALLLRSRSGGAIAASLSLIAFFTYDYVWRPVKHVLSTSFLGPTLFPALARTPLLIWSWLVTGLVILLLANKLKNRTTITGAFNVVAFALLTMALGKTALAEVAKNNVQRISAAGPSVPAKISGLLPDIYYIILDGYGREDELQQVFGLSNHAFTEQLTSAGFDVLPRSRANYSQTELCLAAILNLDYVQNLVKPKRSDDPNRYPIDDLLNDNKVTQFLKSVGYQTVSITSGFPAIHPKVDLALADTSGLSLFETELLAPTPLASSSGRTNLSFDSHRGKLQSVFALMDEMGEKGVKPKFVFAHVLMPHPPFVFGPNGEPKNIGQFGVYDANDYMERGGSWESYRAGYLDQLEYLNKMVVQHFLPITRRANVIMIIQGDHGSRSKLDFEHLEHSDVTESYRNLSAFFVPQAVREKLYPTMSSVNTFRVLFDGLFGEALPLLPDRSYYNRWSLPYQYVDVTDRTEPRQITDR